MAFIIIDINSDLKPIAFPIDSDDDRMKACDALSDAGLTYVYVWDGEPGDPAAKQSTRKLFASNVTWSHEVPIGTDGETMMIPVEPKGLPRKR